jgi:hypothetical protein
MNKNVAAIVGGSIGGVAFLAIAVKVWPKIMYRKPSQLQGMPATAGTVLELAPSHGNSESTV